MPNYLERLVGYARSGLYLPGRLTSVSLQYYYYKHGLDFRSLRFPGIISADTQPGGGTTDYAVDIFHKAWRTGQYDCYLRPDTRLPMMYIEDSLRSLIELMEAPGECLTQRTYNIHAMDFTPTELAAAIRRYVPELKLSFTPDSRQDIGKWSGQIKTASCVNPKSYLHFLADTWPFALNDDAARRDWNWAHHYDLDRLCRAMFVKMAQQEAATAHVKKDTLLNAIEAEQTDQAKYLESINDNRSVFAN